MPPSSSVRRLIGSEQSRMISPPVLVEPVKATLSTPGCCTRYEPVVGPSPGTTLTTPGGKPDLDRELREAERGERRLGIGLEHDRATGRERRGELPRRHQERVVPGDDLSADADRFLLRIEEERAADGVRAACDRRGRGGEEAEVLDGAADLRLDRRDRLADVPRFEVGELLAVRDDRVGERVEQPGALVRRGLRPRPFERRAGGVDSAVDVDLVPHRHTRERLSARGLAELAKLAGGRLRELAGDEEPVLRARLRRPSRGT